VLRFDHIGILTRDVDKALLDFATVIGATEATDRFDDQGLTVSVRFLRDPAGMIYEFIAPLGENSVVSGALRKNASIINQIAYRTPSIAEGSAALKSQGHILLGTPSPAIAFGGGHVQFLMSPMGFIIELIEAPDHSHRFVPLTAAVSSMANSINKGT
jgi:methylmalonyl-CoA/ethylmalonyl-CoA epimerase